MSNITTTSRVDFECGYIYDRSFEAHRYTLEITVDGPQRLADLGMIISFEHLQSIMVANTPDKAYLLSKQHASDLAKDVAEILAHGGIATLEVPTTGDKVTAENLLAYLVDVVQNQLHVEVPGVRILQARLRENSKSFVEWKRED